MHKIAGRLRAPRVSALESHLGYWLRFVSAHVSHRLRLRLAEQGVTVSEWVMLREIYRQGPSSQADLAHRLGLDKGAVSRLTERLCSKHFLEKEPTESDRRQHRVALTGIGRALVPTLAALADENDADLFRHLSSARRQFIVDAMKETVRVHRLKPPVPE